MSGSRFQVLQQGIEEFPGNRNLPVGRVHFFSFYVQPQKTPLPIDGAGLRWCPTLIVSSFGGARVRRVPCSSAKPRSCRTRRRPYSTGRPLRPTCRSPQQPDPGPPPLSTVLLPNHSPLAKPPSYSDEDEPVECADTSYPYCFPSSSALVRSEEDGILLALLHSITYYRNLRYFVQSLVSNATSLRRAVANLLYSRSLTFMH